MATPNNERTRLIRVQGPALPVVAFVSEAPPVGVSELSREQGPARAVVTLMSEPAEPLATVQLALPLAAGDDGTRVFETLHAIVQKVNEIEALRGRAGVWVDGARSGVCGGKVEIVLAPNDPSNAVETCKRMADYLFAASRQTPGVVVKVFAADRPETPVYELAV